jgi:predicted metal-dependent peptidase
MQEWLIDFVHRPEFLKKYRYYASVLAKLDPIEDPFVDLMAVSVHGSRFYLHVNTQYWANPKHFRYLVGVLLHEVHHIVLGHLGHEKFANPAHPDLMELAMEISANEYICEPLPGQPPTWQQFPRYGIGPGQSTLERYHLLVQARRKRAHIVSPKFVDTHLISGVGRMRHSGAVPAAVVRSQVEQLIRTPIDTQEATGVQDTLLAGRPPVQLLEELLDTRQRPRAPLDWKTALRMFVHRIRRPSITYVRPNRRFRDQVGVIPGRIYHPSAEQPTHLLVAIDTSASMSTAELSEIGRQLLGLGRLVRITVVECDAVIHRIYPFTGQLRDVAGRGGTDLRPVFAPELLLQHRPDGIVYFTDGMGSFPPTSPPIPTLWVLTKRTRFPCPWGEKTYLRCGATP